MNIAERTGVRVKGVAEAKGTQLRKGFSLLAMLGLASVATVQGLYAQGQPAIQDSATVWKKMQEAKAITIDGKKIEITQSLQLWDVYTLKSLGDQEQESRNDMFIRRGRLGVKGSFMPKLHFNVAFAYDGIGRAEQTAGHGKPNGDNREFYLWEAFTTWSYSPGINVTVGYFRPQAGREHMTAAFKTSSFEKSLSNYQYRTHTIARSTGRELGVNLGGLHKGHGWSINYNVGLFDMSADELIGEGTQTPPMLASRLAFTLGDPEMEKYGIGYTHSYYGKRKGITLGINSTYQGETEVFTQNGFYGADLLANWGGFDFTAEYDWLYRTSKFSLLTGDIVSEQTQKTTDGIFTYKLAYNVSLKNTKVVQVAAMYSGQNGMQHGENAGLNSFTGATDQHVYDVGINYLINKDNLKLNLHYVWGEREDKAPHAQYAYIGTGFQYLF